MKESIAQLLISQSQKDYNLIALEFAKSRKGFWSDLSFLLSYCRINSKVLDLGCGSGRLYSVLKEKRIDYLGVDFSQELINQAILEYPEANFKLADVLNLPQDLKDFDLIYSLAVWHHIPSEKLRLKFLLEAKKALKKGGLLILTVWALRYTDIGKKYLFKYGFKRLFGLSSLDPGDILYPFKDNHSKILINRYLHLFSLKELINLAQEAQFQIIASGLTQDEKGQKRNIYAILKKI